MKISIVTPTIRKEGLELVEDSIKKQNYSNWEWLIGSPFNPKIKEANWVEDDFEDGFWSLNRIYNEMFKQATGDIIVSWQDWVWVPAGGLQKFVDGFESFGDKRDRVVISGVGDQYDTINDYGKPIIKVWSDPRKTDKYGSFYECYPSDVEWNWCALPREAIFAAGGMDEELDFLGFGMDGYQVNERLDAMGYKFYLDQSNESYTMRHGRDDFGGEENWNKNNNLNNGEYERRREWLEKQGEWPILNYLEGFDTTE